MPHQIPVVFRSNYEYHFIIIELENLGLGFKGKIECHGENTKKYKAFSDPVGIELKNVGKDGNENVIIISYKIKFIDKAKFMGSLL